VIEQGIKPGALIPAFTLKDVNGKEYHSNQFLGTPFLLYFLRGTW
jgi:peroxiredoxin